MFSHIDDEDHQFHILGKITDQNSDQTAILISDGFIKSINRNNLHKKIMDGWKLQVDWKDG